MRDKNRNTVGTAPLQSKANTVAFEMAQLAHETHDDAKEQARLDAEMDFFFAPSMKYFTDPFENEPQIGGDDLDDFDHEFTSGADDLLLEDYVI